MIWRLAFSNLSDEDPSLRLWCHACSLALHVGSGPVLKGLAQLCPDDHRCEVMYGPWGSGEGFV